MRSLQLAGACLKQCSLALLHRCAACLTGVACVVVMLCFFTYFTPRICESIWAAGPGSDEKVQLCDGKVKLCDRPWVLCRLCIAIGLLCAKLQRFGATL